MRLALAQINTVVGDLDGNRDLTLARLEEARGQGADLVLLDLGGTLVGVTICEDMCQPGPPATDLALAGAELLVNISASPFHVGKEREREEMFVTRARDNACFVAFCNAA